MREDSKAIRSRVSASEFLATIEVSGLLPESRIREVRDRLASWTDSDDATALARRLVKEGTLTSFQARRLLKGKKRGLVFGRYILLDHIGQGARGRVFKARHSLMDRVVALKVVLPDASLSKRSVSRFFREMKIVGRLDHPNVVRALDADEHESCPYIVMEYLEGQDLEQVFARRGPLPPDDVIDYMAQAARGLAHAHEMGVIHRDIKPTNLFLVNTGLVKVLDLGLGDLIGAAQAAADGFDTDEGVVVGTTDFMSPELVKNQPVDARADLFSLGCTMYRLLTGEYAFPGLTREARLVRRIREKPVPITDLRPNLSYTLVNVVDRLLATDPNERYGNANELAEALEALLPKSRAARRFDGRPGSDSNEPAIPAIHSQPEASLDWSLIESALRPDPEEPRHPARLLDRPEPELPASKALASHRQTLEEEGLESGREVHDQYRHEVIQMARVRAELQAMDPDDTSSEPDPTWLERMGERIGDYLADPDPSHFVIAGLVILLLLGLALARAVG